MIAKIICAHEHENHIWLFIPIMKVHTTITVSSIVTFTDAFSVKILVGKHTATARCVVYKQLRTHRIDNLFPPGIFHRLNRFVWIDRIFHCGKTSVCRNTVTQNRNLRHMIAS